VSQSPHRDGRRQPPTGTQARALHYWAGCSIDQADVWATLHGAPPPLPDRSIGILVRRGWLWPYPPVHILTDAGRAAVGLPRAHRDRPCPACRARRGARCVVAGMRVAEVHDVRTGVVPGRPVPPPPRDRTLLPYDPHTPVGYIVAT
jgi:hypothetical protein